MPRVTSLLLSRKTEAYAVTPTAEELYFTMAKGMVFVVVSVTLLLTGWGTSGLDQCVDREQQGCLDLNIDCDNPGIGERCMKTCNFCTTNGNVPECLTGHVDNGTSCKPCADCSLEDIINSLIVQCPQICLRGSWGRHCDKRCDYCTEGRCETWSGRCLTNCPNGRYGDRCQLHCENCLGGNCDRNGNCQIGCLGKWYGPQCLQRHDD